MVAANLYTFRTTDPDAPTHLYDLGLFDQKNVLRDVDLFIEQSLFLLTWFAVVVVPPLFIGVLLRHRILMSRLVFIIITYLALVTALALPPFVLGVEEAKAMSDARDWLYLVTIPLSVALVSAIIAILIPRQAFKPASAYSVDEQFHSFTGKNQK